MIVPTRKLGIAGRADLIDLMTPGNSQDPTPVATVPAPAAELLGYVFELRA